MYIHTCQSHLYMYLWQLVLIREDSTVVLLQLRALDIEDSVATL